MMVNLIFELSMTVDTDHFQKMFSMAYDKSNQLREIENSYLDLSMAHKGIIVIFRNSQYKKKVRLFVNSCLVVGDPDDTDKLTRKLEKRIAKYFNHQYRMGDFTLSGVNLISDIDVGNSKNVTAYMKVLRRVGKVKGFSPTFYDGIDGETSFCLSGNSNSIDFLLYDLENMLMAQLHSTDVGWNKAQSTGERTKSILRAEVRLTKPKAIQIYTISDDASDQIMELLEKRQWIFLDTFARAVPYGDIHKKETTVEIIRREVGAGVMRRKMLRLVALIPEKKSLHLAQKTMNCRDVEKVMETFAKINLSPVTISKRHDVKHLENLYSFL